MRRSFRKWAVLAAAAVFCVTAIGGDRGSLRADERSTGAGGLPTGVAEARKLVEVLEARTRAAEADLARARDLLSSLEGMPRSPASPDAPGLFAKSAEDETKLLEGVWRIVAIGGNRPGGEFQKPPYDEYKIMTAGHYVWLSFDPQSGEVRRSGGGTYAVKDGVYNAHVDYSKAPDLRQVVGQEYKGTSRLVGKQLYHFGTMTNGAVFDELWERVH